MKRYLKLLICTIILSSWSHTYAWLETTHHIRNEGIEKVLEEVAKSGLSVHVDISTNPTTDENIKEILETVKAGIPINSTVNVSPQVDKQIQELLTTVKAGIKINIDQNSILTHNNARSMTKTIAFAAGGLLISSLGAKITYDAYSNIMSKLQSQENKNHAWYNVLSARDYGHTLLGLATMFAGFKIIANSDSLA